ncbi:hypothetical protein MIR68_009857 [Amoeboaphelidium protococcarum]|nr:hypothetical protein MIR68_009857 [Amoeboaphelidium protococcarum]
MPSRQARYYLLTIPFAAEYVPAIRDELVYLKGQQEVGEGGYHHWQIMAQFNKKVTLTKAKSFFPNQSHLEQSRSQAADDYVWKEDTRVPGTQFELGERPVQRNRQEDWNQVWQQAVEGEVDQIPADIRIRCYNQIRRIGMDHMVARPRPNISVKVFYGVSGSGKTFGAVQQLGDEYYDKLPTTKFWDGYKGEKKVLIDEFRGEIGVSHLLKWCDKYKCCVETKGAGYPLNAEEIIITSNLHPNEWWPALDETTKAAFLRRVTVVHYDRPYERMVERMAAVAGFDGVDEDGRPVLM